MSDPNEGPARWLTAARAGSKEALGQVLDACRGYLLLIAQRELGAELLAKGGASDLVQETLLEAFAAFDRFHGTTEEELRQWLRRLLQNNIVDFGRQFRNTDRRQLSREASLDQCSWLKGFQVEAGLPSPSEVLAASEEADRVQRALDRLPENYRQVIILRFRESRSFDEIGQILGLSNNAARKLLLRAVERTQQVMGEP